MHKGKPAFIENDGQAAVALRGLRPKVADVGEATDLVLAFGELRAYALQLKPRKAKPGDARKSNGWNMIITETRDGWQFQCTFMTDPKIQHCVRYTITVSRTGKLTVKKGRTVYASARYA